MADRFVYISGTGKAREKQMAIFGICRNYKRERQEVKDTIRALCAEVGGLRWGAALFGFLTTDISIAGAAIKYCIPEKRLTELRRAFYERWPL